MQFAEVSDLREAKRLKYRQRAAVRAEYTGPRTGPDKRIHPDFAAHLAAARNQRKAADKQVKEKTAALYVTAERQIGKEGVTPFTLSEMNKRRGVKATKWNVIKAKATYTRDETKRYYHELRKERKGKTFRAMGVRTHAAIEAHDTERIRQKGSGKTIRIYGEQVVDHSRTHTGGSRRHRREARERQIERLDFGKRREEKPAPVVPVDPFAIPEGYVPPPSCADGALADVWESI